MNRTLELGPIEGVGFVRRTIAILVVVFAFYNVAIFVNARWITVNDASLVTRMLNFLTHQSQKHASTQKEPCMCSLSPCGTICHQYCLVFPRVHELRCA